MVTHEMARSKVSACLYIGREVLKTANDLGLNLSRVSENALVEAIRRLDGPEAGKEAVGSPGLVVRRIILKLKSDFVSLSFISLVIEGSVKS